MSLSSVKFVGQYDGAFSVLLKLHMQLWWERADCRCGGEHGWPKREVSLDTVRSALLSIKAVVCLFFAGNGGKTLEPKDKTKLKAKQTHAPAMLL